MEDGMRIEPGEIQVCTDVDFKIDGDVVRVSMLKKNVDFCQVYCKEIQNLQEILVKVQG
jgi:hypothetical protein